MKKKRRVKSKQDIEIQAIIYAYAIVFITELAKLRSFSCGDGYPALYFTILCNFLTSFPENEPY